MPKINKSAAVSIAYTVGDTTFYKGESVPTMEDLGMPSSSSDRKLRHINEADPQNPLHRRAIEYLL